MNPRTSIFSRIFHYKFSRTFHQNSHDSDDLPEPQVDAVHLGDEDTGHGDEHSGTVHIGIATDGQDESSDSGVDSELFRHQAERDRERGSPAQSSVSSVG